MTARPVRFCVSSRPGRTETTPCTSVLPRTGWATQSAPTPNWKCTKVSARTGAPSCYRSFFSCITVCYIRGVSPLPDPGWFPPPSRVFGIFFQLHTRARTDVLRMFKRTGLARPCNRYPVTANYSRLKKRLSTLSLRKCRWNERNPSTSTRFV